MLNKVLIIILTLIIIRQLFIIPKRENLENVGHLDIIHRLVSHPNIKDPEEEDKLIDFTRDKK